MRKAVLICGHDQVTMTSALLAEDLDQPSMAVQLTQCLFYSLFMQQSLFEVLFGRIPRPRRGRSAELKLLINAKYSNSPDLSTYVVPTSVSC